MVGWLVGWRTDGRELTRDGSEASQVMIKVLSAALEQPPQGGTEPGLEVCTTNGSKRVVSAAQDIERF